MKSRTLDSGEIFGTECCERDDWNDNDIIMMINYNFINSFHNRNSL